MFARARLIVVLAAAGTLAGAAPAAHAASFAFGVAAGEVSATGAKVWTRADRRGTLIVSVGRSRSGLRPAGRVTAVAGHDFTVTVTLRHLRPDTTYYYAFRQGSHRSDIGRFRTAPASGTAKTVRFAWSGDADAQPLQPGGPPFWNRFQIYSRMLHEGNAFNINLGDTIYSDTEVGATTAGGRFVTASPPATTVAEKWAKYKMNLGQAPLRRLRESASLYSQWDDHEFLNDFSKAELGSTLYRAGVAAFRDYAPVRYTAADGLYRSVRWGRNLELFFLDERSFRSAKASANHVCDNPQTDQPDLAPTAPADRRAFFSLVVPSLSQPVSQACLAAIDDPHRTMLGARQYARFTRAIKASTATWKVVVNEVPIQQFYMLPYDRWEGYAYERGRLLRFLKANVKNVVFLTTDVHANLVNDARLQTLEPGGPIDSGILDITTGPVATKSYSKEVDEAAGSPGAGKLLTTAFLKPPPPQGVGMSCAATDVFSYGEVEATSRRLTVHLNDAAGHPVIDGGTGKPCAPIVLVRR